MDNNNQTSLKDEFIEPETRHYKYKIGKNIASSLSGFLVGFIAGAAAVALVWWAYMASQGNGVIGL